MGSTAPLAESGRPQLGKLQEIYDQHRFLDAWTASAALWTSATDLHQLSGEELVFAGRLAMRLGGFRLSRSLFWKARKRNPLHPVVRYFTDHLQLPRQLLLDELAAFEADPELGGGDDELRANWLASHAYSWGKLRNYPRAKELLQQAHSLRPGSSWLYSLEADILGFADDWRASLQSAERAWELDERAPWAGTSLAAALMNLGEVEEAVRRLSDATRETQSAQLLQTTCWYQCALAEVLEGDERATALAEARTLALRIEPLAPLADREFKAGQAKMWLDIAHIAEDHAEMERWAKEARSPFHRQMLANLKQNPEGRRIRLPYRRTIQKHLECVPTSLGSALSATGIEVSVEELAADVTFGGTAEWVAADWLRNKGLHVRFFPATAETAARLIDAGIGFIVTWDDDESGHAVAIVGIDHAAGVVEAHNPLTFRGTQYLLRIFDPGYSPLGVLGMAAVTAERARELDAILPEEALIAEAAQAHQKALTLYGPTASAPLVAEIATRFPSHPGTQYLQATQDMEEGRMGRALTGFRALLEKFPNAPSVRVRLMLACRAMGDTALLRQTLHSVVETGLVPGMESESEWIHPHPRYLCEYADLLLRSSGTRPQAQSLLRNVLRRNWASASAWHILADCRWEQRDTDSALLAYSIASFLAPHNEHYARAYVDVLSRCHRSAEGLKWLEERARQMGQSAQGISTWITWIGVLAEHGYPERGITACEEALKLHEDNPALLAFAVSFFARMGRWDEAERQLRILEKCKAKSAFHEAAVSFYLISGQPATALEHAEAWVAELPRSMEARYALLDLISTLHGQTAATERAVEWMRQHGVHEDFEQAFCQYAQNWQKIRVMKMRVKRIREDGWAWRELVFSALGVFERSDEIRRKRIQPRIEEYLAEVDRVAAGDAATIRAHGLWKEAQSDWRGAVESYLNAIRCEPEHIWAYRRAWECSARLSEAEQRSLWAVIEPIYLEISSHLPNSLEMMRLLAARFGARDAERIVAEWRRLRPDDPNVLEAVVDLLLEHGHGRSDALRALELLRAAVGKFPYHAGLRFSLARACRAVGDYCGAREVFEELVRRRPENTAALMQLAWIQHREGETALALETLDRSRLQAPQESAPFETRAQILMDANRHEEAQAVLQDALQLLPNSVHMRERAITLLTQCGRREEAVEAARQGTRIYPQGAYLWLLLGKILKELPQFAAPGEIEFSLRHSLKWNHGLHEAADWLAIVLVEQLNFKHATDLLAEMEAKLPDPSPVFGRLAWIKRQSGEKSAAVTDLAAVVRKAPWYGWGWNLLLAWLEEDKNWMLCAELLKTVPPQMLTDLAFRQRRLLLLEKAKVAESSTASEWDQLLADFPEDIDVHLRRYDSLREAERVADAAAVLRRIQPIAPDNVYLLARLVRVECDERKYAEALNHALAVSFAAIELNPWPVNQVWDQMRKAGMAAELSAQFFVRLQTGVRPARRALARYADQILDQKGGSRAPKWLRHSFLNHATRQITKLVRLVEKSDWMEGAYLADLLSALNKHGYFKLALSCWNRVKDKGLESSSEAWAQAGRTLVNLGKKREARQLLEGWRTRTGIGMWVLVNYLLCLSRLRQDDLKEIIATCRDALTKLPHDHCARFLAYMEAEACILSGDNEGLIAVWDKYTRYFEGLPQKGEHFPPSQKYLIDELPVAVRLYRQQDARGYAWMHWKLRLRRFWSQQIRAKSRKYFTFILRVAIFLWLFGAVIASFFK